MQTVFLVRVRQILKLVEMACAFRRRLCTGQGPGQHGDGGHCLGVLTFLLGAFCYYDHYGNKSRCPRRLKNNLPYLQVIPYNFPHRPENLKSVAARALSCSSKVCSLRFPAPARTAEMPMAGQRFFLLTSRDRDRVSRMMRALDSNTRGESSRYLTPSIADLRRASRLPGLVCLQ